MSWGMATCELFVVCKNEEQTKAVSERFEREILPNGTFNLWKAENEPLKFYFELVDSEVSSDFDEEVLVLFNWFRENFSLEIGGYWLFEGDEHWRCEVKDNKVIDAGLDWLSAYTVEQINKLRQTAEQKFKKED